VRLAEDEPIVRELAVAARGRFGRDVPDAGLGLDGLGDLRRGRIPAIIFGPTGGLEHSPEEWVDLASVEACADILEPPRELLRRE